MKSAVEADLVQLDVVFALHRRLNPVIDTSEMTKEIGDRVREELDYGREARHAALYAAIFSPCRGGARARRRGTTSRPAGS